TMLYQLPLVIVIIDERAFWRASYATILAGRSWYFPANLERTRTDERSTYRVIRYAHLPGGALFCRRPVPVALGSLARIWGCCLRAHRSRSTGGFIPRDGISIHRQRLDR